MFKTDKWGNSFFFVDYDFNAGAGQSSQQRRTWK